MKFKTLLGAMVALGTIMLASVTAHAATYKAAAVKGSAGTSVVVPVSVEPSGSNDKVNGYIIDVTFNKNYADIVQPKERAAQFDTYAAAFNAAGDEYAAPAGLSSASGVFVGGEVEDGHAVFAWANASAVNVTEKQDIAYLVFDVADATALGTATEIPVTISLKQLSIDGTSASDTAGTVAGKIDLASIIYGDIDGNSEVTANDVETVIDWVSLGSGYTEAQKKIVDVDGNNLLTGNDVEEMINKVSVGDTYKFPVEK